MPPKGPSRFTPTGVGTASGRPIPPPGPPVHPHRRGDSRYRVLLTLDKDGSPPQAWGQPAGPGDPDGEHRFTPTGVGTAQGSKKSLCGISVHPHRRGDSPYHPLLFYPLTGSPPQAWGQLYNWTRSERVNRFTPTGVGTAVSNCKIISIVSVHPHRRGDSNFFPQTQ